MRPGAVAAATILLVAVDHYENFPVASLLCPPSLRPAVTAIYWFARTADDLADEGTADAPTRLADLRRYRGELVDALAGREGHGRWPHVFGPLARVAQQRDLPAALLHDLLDAFEQDVRNPPYPDRAALLDYCRRSANPIGRLLLHLNRLDGSELLQRADAVCSALQLINFWQDLSVDLPRGRVYVPQADLQRYGLDRPPQGPQALAPAARALLRDLCGWARELMLQGSGVALSVPGRMGWELRLVVQGGLRILDKIEAAQHTAFAHRPRLVKLDAPGMMWRAWRMPSALRTRR